jgi:hypothetical protein
MIERAYFGEEAERGIEREGVRQQRAGQYGDDDHAARRTS